MSSHEVFTLDESAALVTLVVSAGGLVLAAPVLYAAGRVPELRRFPARTQLLAVLAAGARALLDVVASGAALGGGTVDCGVVGPAVQFFSLLWVACYVASFAGLRRVLLVGQAAHERAYPPVGSPGRSPLSPPPPPFGAAVGGCSLPWRRWQRVAWLCVWWERRGRCPCRPHRTSPVPRGRA